MDTRTAACLDPREYRRMSLAIEYLRSNVQAQPGVEEIARHVHLSPAHFSRLFHRWSGLTPKQYLQRMTLDAAKSALAGSTSVFDAALAAGLSGPGRLHDLFVTLEAATPGEFKLAGQGLTVRHARADTPFGAARLASTERGLAFLGFADDSNEVAGWDEFVHDWRQADWVEDLRGIGALNARIWRRDRTVGDPLRLWVTGSRFQVQVWRALLRLGARGVLSYGELAAELGRPGAARAVGGAVGANRLAWLIPCHRVLRADGKVGGYRWGVGRKRVILAWEAARSIPHGAASGT